MKQNMHEEPLVHIQASETPFAADEIQDQPGSATADRHSTIDEAAEDIAHNWRKAPQPRRDAHRHKQLHQGRLHPLLLHVLFWLSIDGCQQWILS